MNLDALSFDLLDEGIALLAKNVEQELCKFDPATGRFMQGGGWAVTSQDVMLALAYLYLTEHPRNPYYRDEKLYDMIVRAGDALRSFQYENGQVEFVKVDGSKWGAIYMPWSMYHWLETYYKLEDELSEVRKISWRQGLRLAYEGIYKEMCEAFEQFDNDPDKNSAEAKSVVHNIPVWNAMGLQRASGIFKRTEWEETADRLIKLAVEEQHPDGYWLEHYGPTTLYNLIYIHALGLYHFHRGRVNVIPALKRALRFHEVFTYPDGSRVETVDGRTKYDPDPSPAALIGFSLLPEGRRYAERFMKLAVRDKRGWKSPHFAELLFYWRQTPGQHLERPTLFEQESIEIVHAQALVVKEAGWFACLSGYTTPMVESRWGQDRQSFIGVWHRQFGLIVGGGNSKDQPEWSTFELRTADNAHFHIPHKGLVEADQRLVQLSYGPRMLDIRVASLDRKGICLQFQSDMLVGDQGVLHIPLRLRPHLQFESSFGGDGIVSDAPLRLETGEGEHWLGQGNWRIQLTGPFSLEWPSYPFNPYAQDGKADLSEAVAILTIPLSAGDIKALNIIQTEE